jgi:hypothetical protein
MFSSKVNFELFSDLPGVAVDECWGLLAGDKNSAKLDVLLTLLRNHKSFKGMNAFIKRLLSVPTDEEIKKAKYLVLSEYSIDNFLETTRIIFNPDSPSPLIELIESDLFISFLKKSKHIVKEILKNQESLGNFKSELQTLSKTLGEILDFKVFIVRDSLTNEGFLVRELLLSIDLDLLLRTGISNSTFILTQGSHRNIKEGGSPCAVITKKPAT